VEHGGGTGGGDSRDQLTVGLGEEIAQAVMHGELRLQVAHSLNGCRPAIELHGFTAGRDRWTVRFAKQLR
jgi:hypothetical protein